MSYQNDYQSQANAYLEQLKSAEQQIPMGGFPKIDASNKKKHPLKHFKGNDLEMYYMEKKLKPEVEKEIKKGFFEIRKKFAGEKGVQTARGGKLLTRDENDEEVQVYVSHICLQNYHPIFCKFQMDTVKTFLQYSSIVYIQKGQTLYAPGFNDSCFYVVLFGCFKLLHSSTE